MNQNEMFRFLSVGLPEDIARRKAWGDLEGAIRLIDRELRRQDLPEALRNCMTVEREIMCRIPEDYPRCTFSTASFPPCARLNLPLHSAQAL